MLYSYIFMVTFVCVLIVISYHEIMREERVHTHTYGDFLRDADKIKSQGKEIN